MKQAALCSDGRNGRRLLKVIDGANRLVRHTLALQRKFKGKASAARVYAEFLRHFSNWREIWQAYKSQAALPELRLRGGFTIVHGEGDEILFIFREIFEQHTYLAKGFYRPKPRDTVLDIGANIGVFAIYLQSLARGINVHCFEPALPSRNRLRQNLALNHLESGVLIYPFAISDKNGVAYLGQHVHSVERSLLYAGHIQNEAERVESVTLARAIELTGAAHIDLLKMDIEGGEVEAILGSPIEIWQLIERVSLEYHGLLRPGCREHLTAALGERGFRQIRCIAERDQQAQGILRASK